jgi:phospholipid/cholesterol/gamma-HCH transport system substrate-binding protein
MSAELIVGLFVIAALVCLVYFSVRIGRLGAPGSAGYELRALFSNVGSLRKGADVVIAGVTIGRVKRITLDNYQAHVVIAIDRETPIQEDAIASIKTRGLLGETFLEIAPGGSDVILKPGELIRETEPLIDLNSLIAKYVFSDKPQGE